jgi:ubiquinol-cytochrome c reductase cytochrome c subunit
VSALAARRRHPAAIALLLFVGLVLVGGAYSLLSPRAQAAASGPSLVGVGAAAVDFQVSTGRMPLAGPNVQAPQVQDVRFSEEEIAALGAYVASLAPGPAIPDAEYTEGEGGDVARGGELFRINCAMCHNFAGSGGALTRGKYAPHVSTAEGKYIYEAMVTGPQSMPVFNDTNISPDGKNDIIAYLKAIQEQPNYGGMNLGNLGPVSEGMFIWVFGLVLMIAAAWWLGQKAA